MQLQGDRKGFSRLVMLLMLNPEDAGKSKKMQLLKIRLCAISRKCLQGFFAGTPYGLAGTFIISQVGRNTPATLDFGPVPWSN